jgi:hypothetical protein
LIPLVETEGNAGTVAPAQTVSEVPKLNTGVTTGLMVTVKVTTGAHWPAAGVNEYTPEFWLSTTDGLHVPEIPLVEETGSAGTPEPAQ